MSLRSALPLANFCRISPDRWIMRVVKCGTVVAQNSILERCAMMVFCQAEFTIDLKAGDAHCQS